MVKILKRRKLMNKDFERRLKTYISTIIAQLPVYTHEEKNFIKDLKININEYISTLEDPSMEDILAKFGKPETIVEDYLSNLDINGLSNRLYSKKKRQKLWIVLLVAIFILFSAMVVKEYLTYKNGYAGITKAYKTTVEKDISNSKN